MLDRDTIQSIAHDALSASRADQTEALVTAQDSGLTRFANNAVHQNVFESNARITLRAVVGKRVGIATSNDTSTDALHGLARKALEVARNSEENQEFVSLPEPGEPVETDVAPIQSTADYSPEQRAEAVSNMLAIAKRNSLVAAGQMSTGWGAVSVVNSMGIDVFHAKSEASATVLMQGDDSSGFAQAQSEDVAAIRTDDMAQIAADKALSSACPRDIDPGKYTVILEPLAVTDMVGMLGIYDLHALAHQEGRSFTTGNIGKKVCGENISLWDDGSDARGSRIPYDFEGIPKRPVSIIENGILKGVPYDSFTAGREEGAINTGHALPPPNTWGPVPINLFINTGHATVDEMIEATEYGVLVTRFHYTNMVHPVKTVFTGMTRDGTFLIENGKIVSGLKNMRFTQSILQALSNVDMIGAEGILSDYAWAPALRVRDFEFSSATKF